MSIRHWVQFFRQYLAKPHQIGAFAPSSGSLARAVIEPFAVRPRPARILEVGAGTGAITRHIIEQLGDQDRLDICELNPEFVELLERDVLTLPAAVKARAEGRLEVNCCPAQEINRPGTYDYVIGGLPLNSFDRPLVETILDSISRNLKSGGIYSYYEYIAFGTIASRLGPSRTRHRLQAVNELLNDRISRFQIKRRSVLFNIFPAHVRHWCWDPSSDVAAALLSKRPLTSREPMSVGVRAWTAKTGP